MRNEIELKKKKEELEKENKDFKNKFEFLKTKLEKSLKANQELNILREAQTKDLQQKMVDTKGNTFATNVNKSFVDKVT